MKNPTLILKHPEAQKEKLFALAKQIPGALIGIKIAALLLALEGQRPGWISDVLGPTRMSLNRWIHEVNRGGLKSLIPRPKPGRPARLDTDVRDKLQKHLDASPQEFGLNRVQWDGPTVVVHLKRHFGIKLKVRQAQQWMHLLGYYLKRAGYSYIQAKSKDAKRFERALKKTEVAGSQRDGDFPR